GIEGAGEGIDVLLNGESGGIRGRRLPEPEEVDTDDTVVTREQGHEVLERDRGRSDAVHEHDDAAAADVSRDGEEGRFSAPPAVEEPHGFHYGRVFEARRPRRE